MAQSLTFVILRWQGVASEGVFQDAEQLLQPLFGAETAQLMAIVEPNLGAVCDCKRVEDITYYRLSDARVGYSSLTYNSGPSIIPKLYSRIHLLSWIAAFRQHFAALNRALLPFRTVNFHIRLLSTSTPWSLGVHILQSHGR